VSTTTGILLSFSFSFFEHFLSVNFRQTQVQQDEIRQGRFIAVGVFAGLEEVIQRFLAVGHVDNLVGDARGLQIAPDYFRMRQVVFHVKNQYRVSVHVLSPMLKLPCKRAASTRVLKTGGGN
jgi:hypothetical protein